MIEHMMNQREIHEAIHAADDALIALRDAQKSLSGARNWGLWDIFGGGFLQTMMKHSKIDQAKQEMEQARKALNRFKNELADLGQTIEFDIDMGGFLRFADYFFDDVFSEWMVQSKIGKAREKVDQAISAVEDIRGRLWKMLG